MHGHAVHGHLLCQLELEDRYQVRNVVRVVAGSRTVTDALMTFESVVPCQCQHLQRLPRLLTMTAVEWVEMGC